jgi:hypothetical protein
MRNYQRERRKRKSVGEDRKTTNKYVEWGESWYKSALSKNKEAMRRYKIIKRNLEWII